ncbi:MAG: hypothetical protein HQM10_25560 [Candidatus Riflebacteria bacterium]|nr:hypothetical protein [Candidatus Riflebacteria bacterium]
MNKVFERQNFRQTVGVFIIVFLGMVFSLPAWSVSEKEWTWALFINADNNLDSCGVKDQEELSKIGSSEFRNVVTLIDREKGPATVNYISPGKIEMLENWGEVDMGNYHEFVRFMEYVARNFPARKYIVTIWNHGSGWKHPKQNPIRGISYDDSSGNHISTNQLETALKEVTGIIGKKIEILHFDACLMQMLEVAYASKNHCRYILASEEIEPGDGAPYDKILPFLTMEVSTEDFSRHIVDEYVRSYSGGCQGTEICTQSAVSTENLPALLDAVNGLAKSISSGQFRRQVLNCIRNVQSYSDPANVDLMHFTELLAQAEKDQGIQVACQKVSEAFSRAIIASGSSGSKVKNSRGLAINLPFDFFLESEYRELSFSQNSMWPQMIDTLYKSLRFEQISLSLEKGNSEPLEKLILSDSAALSPEMNQYFLDKLNFHIFSDLEQIPNMDKVCYLLEKLRQVCKKSS